MFQPLHLWQLCHWTWRLLTKPSAELPFLVCDWLNESHRRNCISALVRWLQRLTADASLSSIRWLWLRPVTQALALALDAYQLHHTELQLQADFDGRSWAATPVPGLSQRPLHTLAMSIHEATLTACDVACDLEGFSRSDTALDAPMVPTILQAVHQLALDLDLVFSFRYHPPIAASRVQLITRPKFDPHDFDD